MKIPVYRWRCAPEGLATRRQLAVLGLRPSARIDVAAEVVRPRRGGRSPLRAELFRIDTAAPKRTPTSRQLYRTADLDVIAAHPAIDWYAVRTTPPGRPSPLARLTRGRR